MKFKALNPLIQQFIRSVKRSVKRVAISLIAIGAMIWLTSVPAAASERIDMTVYRDPSCRCCGGWMEHLSAQGFQTNNVPTDDMNALKQQQGVPTELSSCHTAVVDGYVIEGHVPAEDIKRLLVQQPPVAGIAVPGMPKGTPGMESGDVRESFTVFSFDQQGKTEAFNQYSF
jgi:hypothetical protein